MMAPPSEAIAIFIALITLTGLSGAIPHNVDHGRTLRRPKRMLTTICVEIKPSSAQEEPYFMCKGSDLPLRSGIQKLHAIDSSRFGLEQVNPTNNDQNVQTMANDTNINPNQLNHASVTTNSNVHMEQAQMDGKFPFLRPQQSPQVMGPSSGQGVASKMSIPQQVQQSFDSRKEFFHTVHGGVEQRPTSTPEAPKTIQYPPSYDAMFGNSAPPTSASATRGQTLPHYTQQRQYPFAPFHATQSPGMLSTKSDSSGDGIFNSGHRSDRPTGYRSRAEQYQSNQPFSEHMHRPTNYQPNAADVGQHRGYYHDYRPIGAPRSLQTDGGNAPREGARSISMPSAPPGSNAPVAESNARKYNERNYQEEIDQERNAPMTISPLLTAARYRAMDDAVLGEPNWQFSFDEFKHLRPEINPTMGRSLDAYAQSVKQFEDPVMQAYYASLQDNHHMRNSAFERSSRVSAPTFAQSESTSSQMNGPKSQQGYSCPGADHMGVPKPMIVPSSQVLSQLEAHQRTFQQALVPAAGNAKCCDAPQYPAPTPHTNCQDNSSFKPVYIVLPCYDQNNPLALPSSIPEANNLVSSSLVTPIFQSFSPVGIPITGPLYGTPQLFPLLALSNQHRNLGNGNRSPATQTRSSSDAVIGAAVLPEANNTSSKNPNINSKILIPSPIDSDASSEHTKESEVTKQAEETESSEELFNESHRDNESEEFETTSERPLEDIMPPSQQMTNAHTLETPLYTDILPNATNIEPETKKTYKMLLGAAKQFASIANSEAESQMQTARPLDKRHNPPTANTKRKYPMQS